MGMTFAAPSLKTQLPFTKYQSPVHPVFKPKMFTSNHHKKFLGEKSLLFKGWLQTMKSQGNKSYSFLMCLWNYDETSKQNCHFPRSTWLLVTGKSIKSKKLIISLEIWPYSLYAKDLEWLFASYADGFRMEL